MPAWLIQPPRLVEEATSGLTVTTCSTTSGAAWPRSTKKRPNDCWVEVSPMCARPTSLGGAGAVRGGGVSRSRRCAASSQSSASGRPGGEGRPRVGAVGAELGGELLPLLDREQRGVVGRVALRRQRPGLDRVGEHDRRAVGRLVGLAEGVEQVGEVVAAEVPQRGRGLGVGDLGQQPLDRAAVAAVARQALAQLRDRAAQQPLVLLVAHLVDPPAQGLAAVALEELAQAAAVLDRDRLPAGGVEHRPDPARGDVGHDPVERLAVEVDDPEDLAEARDHRVDERFPDRPLVELGVAEDRDLAPAAGDVEVPGDVTVGERAPHGRRRADPDRAG